MGKRGTTYKAVCAASVILLLCITCSCRGAVKQEAPVTSTVESGNVVTSGIPTEPRATEHSSPSETLIPDDVIHEGYFLTETEDEGYKMSESETTTSEGTQPTVGDYGIELPDDEF